ncbi:arginyltransferase [Spiribacter halobius]|uniref:Aspartate/glutamate leucyltransferase n=1 Tax=Sediminicurvatus halobius TaxID=2182432 RepID=A0A2U2N055_9GAMM|nr:arginyltransferase [Spiribacter halobius]
MRLFPTGLHECPYFGDRPARLGFVDPRLPLDSSAYDQLLAHGFRRSGEQIYRPICPGCTACRSLRLPVHRFRPRRRHRRCRRDNHDVRLRSRGRVLDPAHHALYTRYVRARHPGGGMDDADPDLYWRFLTADWCHTEFLELRAGQDLLGVAVTDVTDGAFSAVYTFYDPDLPRRSLGTLAILMQIEEAQRRGLDWLYLGYWIEDCPRMSYKADFRPHEVFTPEGWEAVE